MLGKLRAIIVASYEQYGEVNESLSTSNIGLSSGHNSFFRKAIMVPLRAGVIYVVSLWYSWASGWATSSSHNAGGHLSCPMEGLSRGYS